MEKNTKNDMLQVGIIASTHGIKGEAKIFPTTDDVKRFKKLKQVTLDAGAGGMVQLAIEGVKFFKQSAILKFKGIDTIDEIAKYKGKSLYVPRKDAVPLEEGEYFIADLIGMTVVNEDGQKLGTLEDVITTGANDVYAVSMEDGRQLLLPAIKQCILDIHMETETMRVHILDGLL